MSNEYLIHQAREFHTSAVTRLPSQQGETSALRQLAVAVEYLIELEETRLNRQTISQPTTGNTE